MHYMRNDLLRKLRIIKGLSQEEVARRLGISQPQYSLIETGKRTADDVRYDLDNVMALGEPGEFEEEPVYALARVSDGEIELLGDSDGRLGIYEEREYAELASSMLRNQGQLADVVVVPAWLSHVALEVVRRRGAAASQSDLFVVDEQGRPPEAVTVEVAKHAVGLVAATNSARSYEEVASDLARHLVRSRVGRRAEAPEKANDG
jgi:transcriptional regulator with XRE-family HTH domain